MDATDLQLVLGRAGLSARRLIEAFRARGIDSTSLAGLESLIGQPAGALAESGLPAVASAWLSAPDLRRIEADRRWIEQHHVTLIDSFDPGYPPQLARIADAPGLLYVRGDPRALLQAQIAIVGTRTPTLPGLQTARQWAEALARAGLVVTSGLARGIDGAAHRGALAAGGPTVAVLGTGPDLLYPRCHESLARQIIECGALVTELPPGTAPVRWSFPRRNRLISGLSIGTLVVEAATDSGSLMTARHALDQGRLLFAMPGSIHNAQAQGCHRLIREGARLVTAAHEMLREITPFLTKSADCAADLASDRWQPAPLRLDKGQKILLDALGFEPTSIDTLAGRTGLPSQSVASMLLILELQGVIGAEPGGRFVRLIGARHG